MTTEANEAWPRDLRIYAAICVVWSALLVTRVFFQVGLGMAGDPMQAVLFGHKFYALQARLVLLMQAFIYAWFGFGIIGKKRWALVVAMLYMMQVVLGHLVFVIANLSVPGQEMHVKIAAFEGPVMVLILLYLWIRSSGLIFERDAPR